MPKLSIITACYNHRHFLRECLDSILASDADIEVVFVDDGSTDGSWNLAREMQEHDDRLIAIRLRRNKGLAGALNVGIRASSSPWILKMDADDRMDPRYPNAIIDAYEMIPELNIIYSPARLFGLENYEYRYKDFDPARMIDEFLIPGPAAFKYELWRAVGGYDEGLRWSEDWDFYVRAQVAVGLRPMQFTAALWFYRQHAGPRMSTEGAKHLGELQKHMRSHTRDSVERKAWEYRQIYGDGRGEPKGLIRGSE